MGVAVVGEFNTVEETPVANARVTSSDVSQSDIMGRPPNQLDDLPLRFRWEACRRHPYYLVFWSDARLYRHSSPDTPGAQLQLLRAAMLMLAAIGVTGEPVDPATSFEELGGSELDSALLSGAVQPMTLRSVAVMLIGNLPRAERSVLGAILATSAGDDYVVDGDGDDRSLQKAYAVSRLMQIPSLALDSCPDVPLFFMHLGASQRTILRDAERQIRQWKRRQGITERRVHTDKLQSYLDVWDQREGWTGSGYLRSQEHSFPEMLRQSKQKMSTVSNRYRAAFKMITGHEFSPHLWWRLFAPLKVSGLLNDPADTLSRPIRRHLRSPVRRPVPETVVAPVSQVAHPTGIVESGTATGHDLDESDLLLDLQDYFDRGLPDEEIARRLGARSAEEIAYARDRFAELRAMRR